MRRTVKGSWRSALILALAWAVIVFLSVPSFITLPVSLTDTDYLALPERGLSLKHWHNLFTSPAWLGAVLQSLLIALAATAVAVVSGTLCAIGCWRMPGRWTRLVLASMLVPIIVPTVVYALGLYRVYARIGLLDTFAGVIIAHAAIGLPFVAITVSANLANFDPKLEQASRNLGANGWQTLRLVMLPNIIPGIVSGAVFAFVASWDELVIVLFIAGRRVHTLPRQVWAGLRESLDPTIAAVATLLIVVTLVMLAPVLRQGQRARTGPA